MVLINKRIPPRIQLFFKTNVYSTNFTDFQSGLATQAIEFFGNLAEALGPILALVGINAGPIVGALIGTLAGAISILVGQGLQELARTEPPVVVIPPSPPIIVPTTTTTTPSPVVPLPIGPATVSIIDHSF